MEDAQTQTLMLDVKLIQQWNLQMTLLMTQLRILLMTQLLTPLMTQLWILLMTLLMIHQELRTWVPSLHF